MTLKISNLKKSFKNDVVLNNISFEINKGEIVTVIGPSGAGKTTLLRCINGLEDIDGGEIKICDSYLVKKGSSDYMAKGKELKDIRKKIGMVFQGFNLFPHMSVVENIIEAPIGAYKEKKEDVLEKAYYILEDLGLKDKANYHPYQLSGGQKQRVAIARALILNPDLICFDEPTSALDPKLRNDIVETIKLLVNKDRSALIITHDMNFAKKVSDRILFLNDGKVLKDDLVSNYINSNLEDNIIDLII